MSQPTKEKILRNASELFGNRAPSSVSLREVAESAGVSKALILKYWKTRAHFVIAVLEYERMKIEDVWEGVDRNTSVRDLCLRLLTSFQSNPRYFNLITRMALDNVDPQVQQWLTERIIYEQIQEISQRLEMASKGSETLRRWSPESLSVFAMLCSFGVPVLGPKIMEWYKVPEEKRALVQQEVMMLCVNTMVDHVEKP